MLEEISTSTTGVQASYLYLARYLYKGEALRNDNLVKVFPVTDERQQPKQSQFLALPQGSHVTFRDGYGNEVRRVCVLGPHNQLVIASAGQVMLYQSDWPPDIPLSAVYAGTGRYPQFLTPSSLVDPEMCRLEAQEAAVGQSTLLGVVEAVARWVHTHIAYRPGVTSIQTRAKDVLEMRQGVCQDLAHVTLAMLRSLLIPCRYASGLLTGEVGETHAWVEFFHPEVGWIPCDPTRDMPIVTGTHYVKFGVGRDYTDVTPIQGEFTARGPGYLDKVVAEARLEGETRTIDEVLASWPVSSS